MDKKLVFVIGAGASYEAGLPTGEGLKGIISELLNFQLKTGRLIKGDHIIHEALKIYLSERKEKNINDYTGVARHISSSMPYAVSIDNFIHEHRANQRIALCGKLAIVNAIATAERHCKLTVNRSEASPKLNENKLKDTWYIPFFKLLRHNCTVEELKQRFRSITLIIFNYDRCVEHFLYHSLRTYYQLSENDTASIIGAMNIYHPYGKIGHHPQADYKFQVAYTADGEKYYLPVEFGEELDAYTILKISKEIKTFTEVSDPNSTEIVEIRSKIAEANRIVFMGFAYDKLNMELLKPKLDQITGQGVVECFGTYYGFSISDRRIIDDQIKELYREIKFPEIELIPCKCNELFDELKKTLFS